MSAGQHNDSRMNLAIALTSVRHGAAVANHTEVMSLLKKKTKTGELSANRLQYTGKLLYQLYPR